MGLNRLGAVAGVIPVVGPMGGIVERGLAVMADLPGG